jgi:hypothetical protein
MRASKYEALVNQPRDAVISFKCDPPNAVNIVVLTEGILVDHGTFERHTAVVAFIEEKYMFFADQADTARQQVVRGVSCDFNVYFREP